jgi:hypothetical protein
MITIDILLNIYQIYPEVKWKLSETLKYKEENILNEIWGIILNIKKIQNCF